MMGMKARALSCKTATCVHDSDAMRSSRVIDRCQLDPILFEVYMTSVRHASRARAAQIYRPPRSSPQLVERAGARNCVPHNLQ